MDQLKLALDWTANTNHSGFFVAQEMEFYAEQGIEVEIQSPADDNYKHTPAKKVELGLADLAICPLESVLSYNTKQHTFGAVALAALYREDISAIVTLKGSGMDSPRKLDGKRYASYKARYEDKIVEQMVRNDGGQGNLHIGYPPKLGIWETLLNESYDATWIFLNWEGVHAKAKGIALNSFRLSDFGIPYGYSPVLMGGKTSIGANQNVYQRFLNATKKGFLYAVKDPQYATKSIAPHIAENDRDIDLLESQLFSNRYYGNETNWGVMEEANVNQFLEWLGANGLETNTLRYKDLVFDGLL